MAFLAPAFLWALTALAIPLLIHLFQLRRFKRIDFPNVSMLQAVTRRTRDMRRVRHWLVLAARMGALAALVLAFAQPYIPGPRERITAGRRGVSVFIDDSYSMDATGSSGRLLDQARVAAREAIMAHDAGDRFQVLTGRLEGRQQVLTGRDEALDAATRPESNAYRRTLSQVMARQREALAGAEVARRRLVLITDLQRSITDVEQWPQDSLYDVVIIPMQGTGVQDLSVDSAWFDGPVRRSGAPERLLVRISNHGDQDLENIPLKLALDGVQRALATFAVRAGASIDTALHFTQSVPGHHWAEISISDPPITFNDKLHLAWTVSEHINVLLVGTGSASDRALSAVFKGDSAYRFTASEVRGLDPLLVDQADLVIINGAGSIPGGVANQLQERVARGGTLAVFPPLLDAPTDHQELLGPMGAGRYGPRDTTRLRLARVDLEQPFYREVFTTLPRNVDLPEIRSRWRWEPVAGSDVLLRAEDGTAFLSRRGHERGQVFVCASALDAQAGGFMQHALFVTTILRMAESSKPAGLPYQVIGSEGLLLVEGADPKGDRPVELRGPGEVTLLPEMRRTGQGLSLRVHGEDIPPGAYAVRQGPDTLAMIGLVVSRLESEREVVPPNELRERIAQRGLAGYEVLDAVPGALSLSLAERDRGRELWVWFVLLALLLLAAEVVLIRMTT